MSEENKVIKQLKEFCNTHGLDFNSLPMILNEPKVVPMIRGIGYEYVIISFLQKLFKNDKNFIVRKTIVNSQLTVKGSDAEIFNKKKNLIVRLECKLASNGSFNLKTRGIDYPHSKIKIMRSRTLGEEMIKRVSQNGESTITELRAHKDSYLPNGFDFVITNLRNAFYITTEKDLFKFQPTDEQWNFLETFFNSKDKLEIDHQIKHTHFYIKSENLTPKFSHAPCNRRECPNPTTCNFIPNYSIFKMSNPMNWKNLKDIREDLI
jgi:hypothetical protein